MWRWKRRNQDGPRPEFGNAADLVRKFRLSPPGHFLSTEALAELAMKGSEQLPNGNWAFRFDPRPASRQADGVEYSGSRSNGFACRC
jgi:hypothetical protein